MRRLVDPGAPPAPVAGEPGELLDEPVLIKAHVLRESCDLGVAQAHLPRPPAASGATLALVEDRH